MIEECRRDVLGRMEMKPEVVDATKAVERASGIPVIVQPDPTLKLIARVVIARGTAPARHAVLQPVA